MSVDVADPPKSRGFGGRDRGFGGRDRGFGDRDRDRERKFDSNWRTGPHELPPRRDDYAHDRDRRDRIDHDSERDHDNEAPRPREASPDAKSDQAPKADSRACAFYNLITITAATSSPGPRVPTPQDRDAPRTGEPGDAPRDYPRD